MNEALIIRSVLMFIFFWGIGMIMLWFRPRIELFWKVIASLILLFYVWFFLDEIQTGIDAFMAGWFDTTMLFLKELATLVFINLFFLWPLCLVIIFYKADDMGAEKLLKFMCILTLVLWVIFVVYFYYSHGIDEFLFKKLKKMIPNA